MKSNIQFGLNSFTNLEIAMFLAALIIISWTLSESDLLNWLRDIMYATLLRKSWSLASTTVAQLLVSFLATLHFFLFDFQCTLYNSYFSYIKHITTTYSSSCLYRSIWLVNSIVFAINTTNKYVKNPAECLIFCWLITLLPVYRYIYNILFDFLSRVLIFRCVYPSDDLERTTTIGWATLITFTYFAFFFFFFLLFFSFVLLLLFSFT